MSKRSNATNISKKVKDIVWIRDKGRCIICHSSQAFPNAHYIPRSNGGLGIEENIVTLCKMCHFKLDQTSDRKELLKIVKSYLDRFYKGFNDEDRKYKRD